VGGGKNLYQKLVLWGEKPSPKVSKGTGKKSGGPTGRFCEAKLLKLRLCGVGGCGVGVEWVFDYSVFDAAGKD